MHPRYSHTTLVHDIRYSEPDERGRTHAIYDASIGAVDLDTANNPIGSVRKWDEPIINFDKRVRK